tara:strand:+ start:6023 stop:6688 length:666 start_codon:yes stop_codon:yes gene_type:complete
MSLTSEQNNIPTMLSKHYKKKPNIKLKKIQNKKSENVVNSGTGAGGAQTNINGKKLEANVRNIYNSNITSKKVLPNYCKKSSKYQVEDIEINGKNYIHAPEDAFECYENNCNFANNNISKAMGAIQPDDCFIDLINKVIIWIECKFQQGSGSVVEKLQSCSEKIENLERRFPGFTINYCYVLNPYLKETFKWEIERLDEKKIPYVVTDDPEFEKKLLNLLE